MPKPAGRARHSVALTACLLACSAGVVGGAFVWRAHRHAVMLASSAPAMPDLSARPAKLRAAIAAADVVARTPDRALDGLATLGRLYQANGFRAEAEVCWRRLRAEQPDNPHWAYYLADLRRTANDYAEMTELLRATVRLAPDYSPAWLALAEQELKTGDSAAAAVHYQRRLDLVPGDPYARLGLARLAQQAGRITETRSTLERIVHDAPDFQSAHNLYSQLLDNEGNSAGAARERELARRAGRFREADDPWLNELNASCYDPKRLFVLATVAFQTGQGDRGLGDLERAVAILPDDPAGYEMLGNLQLKLGDPGKARAALEKCVSLAGSAHPPPIVFVLLSQACRELKQPADALRAAEQGLEKSGDAPELQNARGAALNDMGRRSEAIEAFRRAIALDANNTEANFNLGAALLAVGEPDEALRRLHQALVAKPRFAPALALLGRIAMDSGRLGEAAQYLRPLLDSDPEATPARQLMSEWYWRSGTAAEAARDPSTAERDYRAGLQLVPESAELNASLGVLLLVQSRFADARAPLEAYRRVKAGDPQAALFLAQAYLALGRIDDARRLLTEGAAEADRLGRATTAAHCREILQQL